MDGNESNGFVTGENSFQKYGAKHSRRLSMSAPAAIHVSTLPKIATGRSIHSANQLWRDHELIETQEAIRERSAKEESRHNVYFSKYPKSQKMSRVQEMKPFRVLHSEVLGMSKAKLKEMYSEVTYLTNAVRNCDGIHSFKNLSTHDHLLREPFTDDHQTPRWKSATQKILPKRHPPPAPPANVEKVSAWDEKRREVKSIPLFTDLEKSSQGKFLKKYGQSKLELNEKETKEIERKKRRDDFLKFARCNSASETNFVIDNAPDVNILRRNIYFNQRKHKLSAVRTRSETFKESKQAF
ncbi:uncharacterized protein LOC117109051 isoform X2 [Anneissia japonica]|uniref:uncharacterized protein LOC117109051 isoform X2 n=1 Tax=Anneissia japonica TaxID=1529436 RepID=UPI0014257896|nr:uncharacterized protein LOC117109051 isoform X2 [Anneissia japonica]